MGFLEKIKRHISVRKSNRTGMMIIDLRQKWLLNGRLNCVEGYREHKGNKLELGVGFAHS